MESRNKEPMQAQNYKGNLLYVDLKNHQYLIHGKVANDLEEVDNIISDECQIIQDSIVDFPDAHTENFH